MNTTNMSQLAQQGYGLLIALGIKILEALALWIVGRWLIGFSIRLIRPRDDSPEDRSDPDPLHQ